MISGTFSRLVSTPFKPPRTTPDDQRQRDRNPRIDVIKLDQQSRQAAGNREDTADRQVDFDHRHQIDHAEGDDADQRRLAQDRLDRAEAEELGMRNANGEDHQQKDDDQAGILRPAPAQPRKLALDRRPLGVAGGI